MGRVYRALEVPLGRVMALKVLDSKHGLGLEESFRQRFLVEAALTARLTHPNTVRVLDYGQSSTGLFFIAMEYLEGESLESLLERGPLPWRRVLGMGQQMARSLREAHALGVVHRDLKPANVMRLDAGDGSDHLKVLDFGLVKSFIEGKELVGRALTEQGMVMGSPPYMAPEQGESNRADPRSDVYSLGVVLYEALTGAVPFGGVGPLEIIMKHVRQPVPPVVTPKGLEPIPPAMVALVNRCLAKSPMDRFQSMQMLLEAMQQLTRVGPAAATSGAPTEPVEQQGLVPARSRRTVADLRPGVKMALGGALSLTVALAVGFAVVRVYGTPNSASRVDRPPPRTIRLHVESEPTGATVSSAQGLLGTTPLELDRAADPSGRTVVTLSLRLEGYHPVTVTAGGPGPRLEIHQRLEAEAKPQPREQPPSER